MTFLSLHDGTQLDVSCVLPIPLRLCLNSTAIDMWSVGVILLSIMTHRHVIFLSGDDHEALEEIAAIHGHQELEELARILSAFFLKSMRMLIHDTLCAAL